MVLPPSSLLHITGVGASGSQYACLTPHLLMYFNKVLKAALSPSAIGSSYTNDEPLNLDCW